MRRFLSQRTAISKIESFYLSTYEVEAFSVYTTYLHLVASVDD